MILLISPKGKYATNRLIEEAGNLDVPLEAFDVKELAAKNFNVEMGKYSALYVRLAYPYFEQTISLAKKFREAGKYVVDEEMITSGFETSKKAEYDLLTEYGIPIPKTQPLQSEILNLKSSIILKWIHGFGGENVHLIKSENDFQRTVKLHPRGEWLAQEYIAADYEYKVITVGYRSLPVILRFKISDLGFKIDLYKYSIVSAEDFLEVAGLAERASRALGRELAKVDILQKDGQLYVLEVNRSPSLLPFEPYSKCNVAKEFLQYIVHKMNS